MLKKQTLLVLSLPLLLVLTFYLFVSPSPKEEEEKGEVWIADQYKILGLMDKTKGEYLVIRTSGFHDKVSFLEVYRGVFEDEPDFNLYEPYLSFYMEADRAEGKQVYTLPERPGVLVDRDNPNPLAIYSEMISSVEDDLD